MFTHQMH